MKNPVVVQALRWVGVGVTLGVLAYALMHANPDLFTTDNSRFIGMCGVMASVAGLLWIPAPGLARRFPRMAWPVTLTQYLLLILGVTLTFVALIRDKEFDQAHDLINAAWAGVLLAAGMVLVVALSTLGAKHKGLPEPGSAKDAISRRVIDREYGKSTAGYNPSDSDYSYMFATYAASRLNDAEKLALIKYAMDAFGNDHLIQVAAAAQAKREPIAMPSGPGPLVTVTVTVTAPKAKPSALVAVGLISMLLGSVGTALFDRNRGRG